MSPLEIRCLQEYVFNVKRLTYTALILTTNLSQICLV